MSLLKYQSLCLFYIYIFSLVFFSLCHILSVMERCISFLCQMCGPSMTVHHWNDFCPSQVFSRSRRPRCDHGPSGADVSADVLQPGLHHYRHLIHNAHLPGRGGSNFNNLRPFPGQFRDRVTEFRKKQQNNQVVINGRVWSGA